MKIETPQHIHTTILSMVDSGVTYIDALVEYSERSGLGAEVVAEIIKGSPYVVDYIRQEAKRLHIPLNEENVETGPTLEEFFA